MPLKITQGYCTDSSHEVLFDDEGYPYRLYKCVIKNETYTIQTPDDLDFYPSDPDYLVLEYDTQTMLVTRAYKPFPVSGIGKRWAELKDEITDAKVFYKYFHGIVKHKEIRHHNDNLSTDTYDGGVDYKVVLTDGRYFFVGDRDGKRLKAGDEVEKIETDERGGGLFHNITTGYSTSTSIFIQIFVYGLSVMFVVWIISLILTTKEWDGFKIFFIVLIAFLPISFVYQMVSEYTSKPKLLKLMTEFRERKRK